MLKTGSIIGGLHYSDMSNELLSTTFVPVVGIRGGTDFDYDSKEKRIYYTRTPVSGGRVSSSM